MSVRLHVNIDHVATLRQARGTRYPDPIEAAVACEWAGADGITVHLREDRRHIQPRDVELLRETVKTFLNLEMAATDAMLEFAAKVKPNLVTLVPEKREERTTEGGLGVAGAEHTLRGVIERLHAARIPVSLFIDPDVAQIDASLEVGADQIELHTGDYAEAFGTAHEPRQLERLVEAAQYARRTAPLLDVAAGHGLTVRNTRFLVAACPEISELNIGHALVSDALMVGMAESVKRFRDAIREAVASR